MFVPTLWVGPRVFESERPTRWCTPLPSPPLSVARARIYLVIAALLWSTGSLFTRLLTEPTSLGLNSPAVTPLQIAFFRGMCAGLILLPLVRPREVRLRPAMIGMVACFGVMSGLYMSALALGPAANAILLQNTAPFWVYLIGVYLLGDLADARSWRAILVGMIGAAVIVVGNWPRGLAPGEQATQVQILLMAAGSGLMYALVVLFLRHLCHESSAWITSLNLIGSATVLASFVLIWEGTEKFATWATALTGRQLVFLAFFGAVQMALPYWLFARGLRAVGTQEAAIITLLEPVLNPLWAYLIAPDRDAPTVWTFVGGSLLLGALGWRYAPVRRRVTPAPPPGSSTGP